MSKQSSSWPKAKTVKKEWLNLKNSEFHSDCIGGWLEEESSDDLRPPPLPHPDADRYGSPTPSSSWRPPKELRMFVGTWNVGGRAPHGGLDLSDWLTDGPDSSSPHIYVLGFQEIVPLNARNVLGAEDKGPARKWLDLIRRALNHPPSDAASSLSSSSSRSHSSPSDVHLLQKGRVSFADLLAADSCRPSTDDDASEPSTPSTPVL